MTSFKVFKELEPLSCEQVSQMSEDYEKCGQKLEIETNAMHEGNVYL